MIAIIFAIHETLGGRPYYKDPRSRFLEAHIML